MQGPEGSQFLPWFVKIAAALVSGLPQVLFEVSWSLLFSLLLSLRLSEPAAQLFLRMLAALCKRPQKLMKLPDIWRSTSMHTMSTFSMETWNRKSWMWTVGGLSACIDNVLLLTLWWSLTASTCLCQVQMYNRSQVVTGSGSIVYLQVSSASGLMSPAPVQALKVTV